MIRDQANKTLDAYLQRIRKHAQTLPDTKLPPPTTSNGETTSAAATAVPRMGTPASDSSWAGWAISSFTNKLSSADGQIQPKANGAAAVAGDAALARAAASNPYLNNLRTSSPAIEPRPAFSRNATETTKLAQSFSAPEEAEASGFWDDAAGDEAGGADDAWGAMDDDDDEQEQDEERPTSSRGSATSTPSRPATSASTGTAAAARNDDEPDFAGWLKAQQAAKAPSRAGMPKGLGPKTAAAPALGRASAVKASATRTAAIPSRPAATTTKSAASAPKASVVAAAVKNKGDAEDEGWGDAWE